MTFSGSELIAEAFAIRLLGPDREPGVASGFCILSGPRETDYMIWVMSSEHCREYAQHGAPRGNTGAFT